MEETSILTDRPPGGWSNLVTNQMLGAKLDTLEVRLRADVAHELREQTWTLVKVVIAAPGVFVAALGGIGARLRFA